MKMFKFEKHHFVNTSARPTSLDDCVNLANEALELHINPIIEKAVEMADWIVNEYVCEDVSKTSTEYNHKSSMTYFKAQEFLLSIRETVADATTLADTAAVTLADASGESEKDGG